MANYPVGRGCHGNTRSWNQHLRAAYRTVAYSCQVISGAGVQSGVPHCGILVSGYIRCRGTEWRTALWHTRVRLYQVQGYRVAYCTVAYSCQVISGAGVQSGVLHQTVSQCVRETCIYCIMMPFFVKGRIVVMDT